MFCIDVGLNVNRRARILTSEQIARSEWSLLYAFLSKGTRIKEDWMASLQSPTKLDNLVTLEKWSRWQFTAKIRASY